MLELNARACPVCKSNNDKTLFFFDSFNMTKCMGCSHVFVKNPKSDTRSGFNPNVDINKPKSRHFQIYAFIKNYTIHKNTITVAEIGSGYGQLGKILDQDGAIDYMGFEPSAERAEFASRKGVTVSNDLFAEDNERYDIVILDNVLEHVSEPGVLMGVVSRSLKKGGAAVVIVPNRFDLRRFFPKWRKRHYWQPDCHINMFSYGDIARICNDVDLSINSFDLKTLEKKAGLFMRIKTVFDILEFHVGGLYIYATKK